LLKQTFKAQEAGQEDKEDNSLNKRSGRRRRSEDKIGGLDIRGHLNMLIAFLPFDALPLTPR
jgi:hypothetical protein